jgi:hypothetical protein
MEFRDAGTYTVTGWKALQDEVDRLGSEGQRSFLIAVEDWATE